MPVDISLVRDIVDLASETQILSRDAQAKGDSLLHSFVEELGKYYNYACMTVARPSKTRNRIAEKIEEFLSSNSIATPSEVLSESPQTSPQVGYWSSVRTTLRTLINASVRSFSPMGFAS